MHQRVALLRVTNQLLLQQDCLGFHAALILLDYHIVRLFSNTTKKKRSFSLSSHISYIYFESGSHKCVSIYCCVVLITCLNLLGQSRGRKA